MPVKNGLPYLPRAVRSTLQAMPRDSELVILNDGSDDGTPEYLESVTDRRVKAIHHQASGGVAKGLNFLLASTDSEHVARMDADDLCLPWRFALQEANLRSAEMVFSSVIFMNSRGLPVRPDLPGRIAPDATPLHLLLGNVLVHPTLYATRQIMDDMGGYRATAAEDYDLWLRAARKGARMVRTAEPVLMYRRHGKQATTTGGWLAKADDPLLDESYGQLARDACGCLGDTRTLRRSSVSGQAERADPQEWRSFLSQFRAKARLLRPAQRALINLRLSRFQHA
ncbi:glycosyltransferase family A protein [Arthrobacter sp. ISL-72]|uniref:glycosyltransferase family 2 protein n=1 Tax=Arthrobacter sp. ISL-72 TaxID=2819114 RepID=UPI0020365144|nr:glycosyltransferase family A protein [Arthrobacter sp. ISL-72]